MSDKIDSGLFLFDFTDHHAVLGVPVDADFKHIRKRYLQIARRLHPDTCQAASEVDKQLANSLLSKLVNPAYEKFSIERNRAEYVVLLREMSKRLTQEAASIQLKSELSEQLKQSNDIDRVYRTTINSLAQKQYQSLEQVMPLIAQISELNMVYLLHKGASGLRTLASTAVINPNAIAKQPPPPQPEPESMVEPYLRRAQTLIEEKIFAKARVELQDALKLEPNNSRCHSLIGLVYLKQNQVTMAKVHINKALQLDVKDELALNIKPQIDKLTQTSASQSNPTKTTQSQQSAQSKNGGLFGGLFGGKKK
ncbi:MAG TPA: molecular chaperone DnaJ [Cyanobacteria bacterium UBA11049]|nr:molecular chaperone DnaJ [Cyanobacteria bacterium UBA11049]